MRAIHAIGFLLAVQSAPALATDWEKVSDADGVVVYAKNLEGVATISLRGEAVVDAALPDVYDALKDNKTAHEWMPLVLDKHDLQVISATERLEYTHIAMPWPMTDRYFINTGTAEHLADGGMKLFVKSVDRPEYREADKVLGELKYSEILLIPEAGKTRVKIEVNTDPKGMIPKFLVNAAQKAWPRDFLTGLRKQLEKRGKLNAAPLAH